MIESGIIKHLQEDPSVNAYNGNRVYAGKGRETDTTSVSIYQTGLNPFRDTTGAKSIIESTFVFDVVAGSKLDVGIIAKAVEDSIDNLNGEIGGEEIDRILLDGLGDSFETSDKKFKRSLVFKIYHH